MSRAGASSPRQGDNIARMILTLGFVDNDVRQNRAAPDMIAPKFGDYCCAYAALAFFFHQNYLRFRNIFI
jgi:hypothetical protein